MPLAAMAAPWVLNHGLGKAAVYVLGQFWCGTGGARFPPTCSLEFISCGLETGCPTTSLITTDAGSGCMT